MNNFMNSANIFSFAYGPENPFARTAMSLDSHRLRVVFDMTVTPTPECAGIAIQFDKQNPAPQSATLSFDNLENSPIKLMIELKENGVKYQEVFVQNTFPTCLNNIRSNTNEIVIVCWGAKNKGIKGDFEVYLS